MINSNKPLGGKAYGSIPHLPGSRRGPADKGLSEKQASICTVKTRDKHDVVYVEEKLDGSNVAVAKINGQIVPLTRSGYVAISSPYEQHRLFHDWVFVNFDKFDGLLEEGERVIGEWLAQAHGTRYDLQHEPFVAFDLMTGSTRLTRSKFWERMSSAKIVVPTLVFIGAISIKDAMYNLGNNGGHGAIDGVEGAVWRVERKGEVDFLGKYVKPNKIDGCFFPEKIGHTVWNWRPN